MNEQKLEKQMQKHMGGCIAGFFNLFDRNPGKRIYTKRLSASTFLESESDSVSSIRSPAPSLELERPEPVPSLELKEGLKSPWKLSREAPRLSLDSQAVVDTKGKLRRSVRNDESDKMKRSPSVIARLMGLDQPLPSCEFPEKKAELRRSSSESRSRDTFRFVDGNPFPASQQCNGCRESNNIGNSNANTRLNLRAVDQIAHTRMPKRAVTIYSEIERRLKMRGIDEPSQEDLETLKQIFEALQLKGLLHSNQQFNFITATTARSQPSKAVSRRNPGLPSSASPRRDGLGMNRNQNPRSPGNQTVTTRKRLNVETQRRKKETTPMERRRVSPVQSPRRNDQMANQSPRRSTSKAEDQSSATTYERLKMEEGAECLLERCDKLLNSIAEITATRPAIITELQPSPVSVLDSSFYKEESSPSPTVMKRTIDFKDRVADLEDEAWSSVGAFQSKSTDTDDNTMDDQDSDFVYVLEILRVSNYLPEDSDDMFLLLEKQQSIKGRDTSNTSRLRRKLIFDSVLEILDRHRQFPPWKSASSGPHLRQVWSELQLIHVRIESEDLFEVICGVMKSDMAGDSIHGWGECHVEMSEAVLDIERLIFKDLVGETIHSLAAVASKNGVFSASRRKLIF